MVGVLCPHPTFKYFKFRDQIWFQKQCNATNVSLIIKIILLRVFQEKPWLVFNFKHYFKHYN